MCLRREESSLIYFSEPGHKVAYKCVSCFLSRSLTVLRPASLNFVLLTYPGLIATWEQFSLKYLREAVFLRSYLITLTGDLASQRFPITVKRHVMHLQVLYIGSSTVQKLFLLFSFFIPGFLFSFYSSIFF